MKKIILSALFFGLVTTTNVYAACGGEESSFEPNEASLFSTCSSEEMDTSVIKEIEYKEGVHYRIVELEADSYQPEPSLLEYIWIGCPDCSNFEPHITEYASNINDISFMKRHSVKNPTWEKDARIYYGLISIGRQDVIPELMEYYVKIRSIGSMPIETDFINFFELKNIDHSLLKGAMESRWVNNKIVSTKKEMSRIGVSWVPTVIVNNKYMALFTGDIKTDEDYIKLVDYLMKKDK